MDCECGSPIQPNKPVLNALDAFGRQRLSKHYFMRDFLYSEIAEVHGIANVPDDAELAIKSGKALCRNLLEPLRHVFGHITIRSAFRSANVNGFGNCHDMNCSSNKASAANHIWDHKDGDVRGFDGSCDSIVWRSEPRRRISSFKKPKGLMMINGEPADGHRRDGHYVDILHHLHGAGARSDLSDYLRRLRAAKREEDERIDGLA